MTNEQGDVMQKTRDENGVLWWDLDGRRFPVMAGAEDPPEGDPPAGDPPAGDPPADPPPSSADPEKQKLSQEAAAYRKQLRDVQAELAKLKEKDLSDAEKLQKRAAEAEARAESAEARALESSIRAHVVAGAVAKNIIDPDAAFLLLDRTSIVLEEGNPTNVSELLDKLVEAKPYLVKATADPDPKSDPKPKAGGTPNPAAPKKGQLTAADLKTMTTAQVMALPKEEVDAALARV